MVETFGWFFLLDGKKKAARRGTEQNGTDQKRRTEKLQEKATS